MIKFNAPWIFACLLFPLHLSSAQYLYPVAVLDQYVYCMYQSSPETIALILWDGEHKEMVPGLLSRYMPAGFHLLPDNSGYSFLDNGILRVKKFMKRSPKSLEFLAPLYDIQVPTWIDAQTGYFAAKVRDSYGIFQFDVDAQLGGLLLDPQKDFMYPQIAGSSLFYIERVKRGIGYQFRVLAIERPQTVMLSNDDETVAFKPILSDQTAQEIMDFHDEPIAFLTVRDAQTAFLISYPAHIDEEASQITCSYYMLKNKNGWDEYRIFDFVIPTSLLFKSSEDRLYESILPLLPRHIGKDIYFVDARESQNNNLNIYVYSSDGKIEQLTRADQPGLHYFAPIAIGSALYCGSSDFGHGLHFIKMMYKDESPSCLRK